MTKKITVKNAHESLLESYRYDSLTQRNSNIDLLLEKLNKKNRVKNKVKKKLILLDENGKI